MRRPLATLCLIVLILAGSASSTALAGGPLDCTAKTTALRYRPSVVYTCPAPVATATATVVRTSPSQAVPSTVTVNGDQVVVDIGATLASAGHYKITPVIEDGASFTAPTTWTTRAAPSHANVKVLYFTAIAPDARRDMLQRVDAANIVAVPRDSDVIDVSTGSMTVAQIEARMKKHQVVMVVGGDASYAFPVNLGKALAWFQSHGHGVVTAGQTHWSQDLPVWSYGSAVGAGTAWDKSWAMYPDGPLLESDRIEGGQIQGSTIKKHFITAGLKSFTVIGPSTGEVLPRFGADLLADFKLDGVPGNRFDSFHQAFLAARQFNATRTVDLGYRPWSSAIAGGGFDPAVSPGGHLLARALLWAANRIPPANTHFTLKPHSPASYAQVPFRVAATDPDPDKLGLRYRYRLGSGAWHWAMANMFEFFGMSNGRHTVSVYAVDSAGNRDPHTARYTFTIRGNPG
jgi:hypothetical protein